MGVLLRTRMLNAISIIVAVEKLYKVNAPVTDKLVQAQVVEPIIVLLWTAYECWRKQQADLLYSPVTLNSPEKENFVSAASSALQVNCTCPSSRNHVLLGLQLVGHALYSTNFVDHLTAESFSL